MEVSLVVLLLINIVKWRTSAPDRELVKHTQTTLRLLNAAPHSENRKPVVRPAYVKTAISMEFAASERFTCIWNYNFDFICGAYADFNITNVQNQTDWCPRTSWG